MKDGPKEAFFLTDIGGSAGWSHLIFHGFKQTNFRPGTYDQKLIAEVECLAQPLGVGVEVIRTTQHWMVGASRNMTFGVLCKLKENINQVCNIGNPLLVYVVPNLKNPHLKSFVRAR